MRALIVDDEKNILAALTRSLYKLNLNLTTTISAFNARKLLETTNFDLLICDQHMPEMSGTQLCQYAAQLQPSCKRIILSAYSDFTDVTEAFNRGDIHQYLTKPWDNFKLNQLIKNLLNTELLEYQYKDEFSSFHGILSNDKDMKKLFVKIKRGIKAKVPMYIYGESGCGKELIAKAIHQESGHSKMPFIPVNCANLNENLFESHMFGHVKGAFTGALNNKKGVMAIADGGTLFLDEVMEISFSLQAKLLRVLQEREFSPVGSSQTIPLNCQIVSSSSVSLEEAVKNGRFRADLQYRLSVIPIRVPPLRERPDDILPLFLALLKQQYQLQQRPMKSISNELATFVMNHSWPGNIRQLQNITAYLSVMVDDKAPLIALENLPDGLQEQTLVAVSSIPEVDSMTIVAATDTVSKQQIINALSTCHQNKGKAAKMLGISRMTLWRKIESFALNKV